MLELGDYLDLSPAAARRQWAGISGRDPGHGNDFTPVETLLCYGLFFVLKPNSYGGSNMHRAPPELHALASTLRRTPASLLFKMFNLDGSRPNGARAEWSLFAALAAQPTRFDMLFAVVLTSAREEGFSEEEVPDFLGVLGGDTAFVGQEELAEVDLDAVVAPQVETHQHLLSADAKSTTRLLEMRIRVGQSRFARSVLANYGQACAFCGFAPGPLRGQGLLVASHIKPWTASDDRERLDPGNGLAACPIHDRAFDRGLLLVNGGLRVHLAGELEAQMRRDPRAEAFFGERMLAPRLLVPPGGAPPKERYLTYHKAHVWRGAA